MAEAGRDCGSCGAAFPMVDGYLDLLPGHDDPVTPIQQLMQFQPTVAIYEGVWRPLGYFLGSRRSFEKDADRIASSVRVTNGSVLDLACGPGTLTRRIARQAPGATVIGFDLSREMLARAVKLTRNEGLDNILYIRGNALELPFPAESFPVVTCCGALQLFPDQDRAVAEISRVLYPRGTFVCQTTIGPKTPPWYVRLADRLLKFGYFQLDVLKDRLRRFKLDVAAEERTRINYIFRAVKHY
jgi:SAM-dependent methyltransferase